MVGLMTSGLTASIALEQAGLVSTCLRVSPCLLPEGGRALAAAAAAACSLAAFCCSPS